MAHLQAHQPLYLKYRPQSLKALVGQDAVSRTLTNAIVHNRITHAYLFTGPRGTGKTSTARILAKSLNCQSFDSPVTDPCQTCSSCVEITAGNSPSVFEIDAASNNSVDDARALIERAPLVAFGGRFKIYIIDECHMLTKEAFNALLKTIEDPPPGVVFVLATTEEHKVLPTIVSRCQRLMFRLARMDDLTGHLRSIAEQEAIEIEHEALQFIARRSGGGLRDALGLLDQASLLAAPGKPVKVSDLLALLGALDEDVLLSISASLQRQDGAAVLDALSVLLNQGREPAVIAQELSRHFLNLLKAGYLAGSGTTLSADVIPGSRPYLDALAGQSSGFQQAELAFILESFDRLEQTLRRTTQPAMHLEIAVTALCHRRDFKLMRELDERLSRLETAIAGQPGARSLPSPAAAPGEQAGSPVPSKIEAVPAAASAQKARFESANSASTDGGGVAANDAPRNGDRGAESSDSQYSGAAADATSAQELSGDKEPESDASCPAAGSTVAEAAGGTGSAEGDGESVPAEDLDHVWSCLIDELQRVNIPAYSIVNAQAFPLAIGEKIMEIGTTRDHFQKLLEQRSRYIKAAAQAVTGRPLEIRFRVVTEAAPASSKPAWQRRESAAARPGPDGEDSEDEPGEPVTAGDGGHRSGAFTNKTKRTPALVDVPGVVPSRAGAASGEPAEEGESVGQERSAGQAGRPAGEPAMIKEAYQLFEGPGSRLIAPEKR